MGNSSYLTFLQFLKTIQTVGYVTNFKIQIIMDDEKDLKRAIDDLIEKSIPFRVNGLTLVILGV